MGFFKNLFRQKTRDSESPIEIPIELKIDPIEDKLLEAENANIDQPNTSISAESKEEVVPYENLPPYEPAFELPEYRPPGVDLFSTDNQHFLSEFVNTHGSSILPVIWSVKNQQLLSKDLSEIKNIFICGSQETGKTSFLNQIIISLLLTKHPSQLKLVVAGIKPLELRIYRLLEKHFLAKLSSGEEEIVHEPTKLQQTLNALCIEMDSRYNILKSADTRNIGEYNNKFIERRLNPQKGHSYLPSIVLIIDDLPGFALQGKELIQPQLERILADGYKVGIFTCITSNSFTGHSLSNAVLSLIGQRVIFNLYDKEDYKKFFYAGKLNKYLNKGEFLFNEGATVHTGVCIDVRFAEIEKVATDISQQKGYKEAFLLPEFINESEMSTEDFDLSHRDPLFEDAARLIVENQMGSTSLLQRRMKLGYNRAGRLMNQLEAAGIVGPNSGSKARDVLIKTKFELDFHLQTILR